MENDDLTIDINEATDSDAETILEIQKLAFRGQGVLYDDFTLPPLVQTLEELVRDFRTYVFLTAQYNGKLVGSVRARTEGDTCFISRLIVHPDCQNKGIGKKLMHAIESKFRGAQRYELFTGHKSAKNIALYGKLGYRKYGEKPQGDNVTLIRLEKRKA